MPTFLSFLFQTLAPRLNNPNDSLFLPVLLENATRPDNGGPLLPLTAADWKIGAITGSSGLTIAQAIVAGWWGCPGADNGIIDPGNPNPTLDLPNVQINGLQNVLVQPGDTQQVSTGYTAQVTLVFNAYGSSNQEQTSFSAPQGAPSYWTPVSFNSGFTMNQSVCCANSTSPDACADASQTITGTGTVQTDVTNLAAVIDVSIGIVGADQARTLSVTATGITLQGVSGGSPSLGGSVVTLKSSNSINQGLVQQAINSGDGAAGIFAGLQTALNDPGNLGSITKVMTDQFQGAIDKALGGTLAPMTDPGGANPVDQYLFDRLRSALNDPTSGFFLPKNLYDFSNPILEPYTNSLVDLGPQSNLGGQDFSDISLTGLSVAGVSNSSAPIDLLTLAAGGEIGFVIDLASVSPPPTIQSSRVGGSVTLPAPPMTIACGISVTWQGDPGPTPAGKVSITLAGATVTASATLTGTCVDDLEVTFTSLAFACPLPGIVVTVTLDSQIIPNDVVNQYANQDSTKNTILSGLNTQLQSQLASISATATQNVRSIVNSRLDGAAQEKNP